MATYATFVTTMGNIKVELLPDIAPKTVENFVGLATGSREWTDPRSRVKGNGPLYSGTIFHRVIPNFMIQGGDPTGTGTGGPGYQFEDEVDNNPSFDQPGYLAMANAGPNTNGCQFFITVAPTTWLNGKHTVFGKVIEGQDVADAISKVDAGANDKPKTDIVLQEIRIDES